MRRIKLGSYLESSVATVEGLNAIVEFKNNYLIGKTVVSILVSVCMYSGINYFDCLFKLGENPENFIGTKVGFLNGFLCGTRSISGCLAVEEFWKRWARWFPSIEVVRGFPQSNLLVVYCSAF